MEEIDSFRKTQISAAESYLEAKKNYSPATLIYVYESTYNYLMNKIRRYV